MQTTDKSTTKQRTQWQDSKAQHALTTALVLVLIILLPRWASLDGPIHLLIVLCFVICFFCEQVNDGDYCQERAWG